VSDNSNCLHDFLRIPQIPVRIAERHGDINDDVQSRFISLLLDLFHLIKCLFRRLMLIALQKSGGYRVRETKGLDGLSGDSAIRTFFIDHDADDLDVVGWIKLLEDLFRVGHLRDGFWRNKRDCVDVLESRSNERTKVLDFDRGGYLRLQALPGV